MALGLFLGRAFTTLGIARACLGVILSHTAVAIPFMMRILPVSFESIPQEIIDAAENPGASPWTKLAEVCFPMILPGFFAGWQAKEFQVSRLNMENTGRKPPGGASCLLKISREAHC